MATPKHLYRIGWRGMGMSPKVRKFMLTLHVIVSVGWLGLDVGLLTLGVTALVTDDPEKLRAAYLAMNVFGEVLVIPIVFTALVTGLVLSFGTSWGLFRYYWVLVKFVLTLGAATASIFALRGHIAKAAGRVSGVPAEALSGVNLGDLAITLVAAPAVALTIYVTATVLSTFKPWGRTPYGRRTAVRNGRS